MFSSATTHSMNTALDIGLFDAVPATGSAPIAALSEATKVPEERLAPLMRHCANVGLFVETKPLSNEWAHSNLSGLLRSDNPSRLNILQSYTSVPTHPTPPPPPPSQTTHLFSPHPLAHTAATSSNPASST